MCGIIGYVGKEKKAQEILINGLERLKRRGYDSAGIAIVVDDKVKITKASGKIDNLVNILEKEEASLGIGHTRWATHGDPSEVNSHPHKQGRITIVHNGIIENYKELKEDLITKGYKFNSETDTEIAAALLDKLYNETNDMNKTLVEFQKQAEGAYALGIIVDDDYETLYTIKNNSALIIGINNDENYIASEMTAFNEYTNRCIILNDGEFAKITTNNIQCFDKDGYEIEKDIMTFKKNVDDNDKGIYEHFMLKEIYQQPNIFKNLTDFYIDMNDNFDSLSEKMPKFSKYNKIVIAACGSAMHAGLIGKSLIEKYAKIPVEVEIASEFRYKDTQFIDDKSLVIAISQSGETADTLEAVKIAKQHKSDTLGIINVPNSNIALNVDNVLYTEAGTENAVATTKAYLAQIALLALITLSIMNNNNNITNEEKKEILTAFKELPDQMEILLNDTYRAQYKEIAKNIHEQDRVFYIGRGIDNYLGMEGSLKLKEIAIINSQAYAAGELKHGTIALIDQGTPVIAVVNNESTIEKTLSNVKETFSRGANVYLITNEKLKDLNNDYYTIEIPHTIDLLQPILTIIPLQLIAYETALIKGTDIDQPKNLAKTVTVE